MPLITLNKGLVINTDAVARCFVEEGFRMHCATGYMDAPATTAVELTAGTTVRVERYRTDEEAYAALPALLELLCGRGAADDPN